MIRRVIELSVANRLFVLVVTGLLAALGVWATARIRLDAIPDLSDVQVIVVTDYPGQSPEVVEDQVTYPLSSALLAVPGAKTVRGTSMFELSFVYVLFDDGTDLYWARSRVLEYLSSVRGRLPEGVEPQLGPDATGVGWVYQYILVPGHFCPAHPQGLWRDEEGAWHEEPGEDEDRHLVRVFEEPGKCPVDGQDLVAPQQDLAQLRSLQDWYLRYPLQSVEGVAEVASIGGFVKQYQVVLDPSKLLATGISIRDLVDGVQRSNSDVGGSVLEISEHEYMVRSRGYLQGLGDLGKVVVGVGTGGTPVLLRDVATLQIAGAARRGVGEWNGKGEAVGGVVVQRFGENAYQVIRDVKAKVAELERGLPPGVAIRATYDRSALIGRAVGTLRTALLEELAIVGLICVVFLGHLRSALVAILVLPVGLLVSMLVMQVLEVNANIMSLGGLALAIGVMVDSAVVMIENAHKHLEERPDDRVKAILEAAKEVGPSLFFSLLVITVSFLPIFVLGEQSGRLFKPLAYTKTFAIAAGAVLGVTAVPALMVFLIRGKIPVEEKNPLNRWSQRAYEPAFRLVMRHPWPTLAVTVLLGLSALIPWSQLGSEFMPRLEEGDLLYMPTTDPSISVTKSKELLQQTDRIIASFPEVKGVHGKIGRAETATDPAPLSMIETVVELHDPDTWRERRVERFHSDWPGFLKWPFDKTFWPEHRRITTEELLHGWYGPDGTGSPGLNGAVSFPGLGNAWPYPIENRINMLATGIKTPVGIKVMGPDLEVLDDVAERVAAAVRDVPGTVSAYAERVTGGYYLDIDVSRTEAARYGLTVGDVQDVLRSAVGGMDVTTVVEGVERYSVNVRYARELRESPEMLKSVLIPTAAGQQVPLGQIARIHITPGPSMIRSEDAQRAAWVYVDIAERDLGGYVEEAKATVERAVPLPTGVTRVWSGRFEYLERARERLAIVIPITLALIVFLLYASNRSWFRVGVILLAVPFSLIGALWFLWALGYHMSLAVWVGIIALLGVDAETGQVMLLYLDNTYERFKAEGRMRTDEDLREAIHEGAVKRIRPKTMTVATDMIGLLPLLWATGSGADVTRRIVAPLIGGIAVSFLMELLVYPVVFYLKKRRELGREPAVQGAPS